MMSIYLNNMKSLQKKDKQTHDIINASIIDPLKYQILKSKSGEPTLQITIEGHNQEEKGILIHSNYDPYKSEASFVDKNFDINKKNFIVYGFGLGYHIDLFLEKLSEGQNLFVIEANIAIIKIAFMTRDLSRIINNPNIKLIFLSNNSDFTHVTSVLEKQKDYSLIIHQASVKAIPSEYCGIAQALQDLKMMQWGIEKNYQLLMDNHFKNMALNSDNFSSLFGKVRDFPIVIVSAGPSLNINKHLLHKIKDHALIFAVGSALKTLVREGIEPNLFCIIDPQPLTYKQIEDYEDLNIPLVYLDTASHFTVSKYKGPKFVVCNSNDRVKDNAEVIDTGGSVATAVLDIAIRLGGNPIIFVGQDLAFTDNQHHAEGNMYGEEIIVKDLQNHKKVEGHKGEIYPTSSSLLSFKNWIERKIEEHPEILFINATAKGAFIKGIQHLELETAINHILNKETNNFNKFLQILESSI